MNKDFRIVKFEQFIHEIFTNLENFEAKIFARNIGLLFAPKFKVSLPLSGLIYIYDYDRLNSYGKFIMSHENFYLSSDNSNSDEYIQLNNNMKKDTNLKYNEFKTFIKDFKEFCGDIDHLQFIFWALMILTVDKTDAEEHLSVICDIAKMLNISDDEMKDITYIIKMIYNKNHSNYQIKSQRVKEIFYGILSMYQ